MEALEISGDRTQCILYIWSSCVLEYIVVATTTQTALRETGKSARMVFNFAITDEIAARCHA